MAVRVEVRNFQSIAHEVIEVDGFAALVGRSNIGKSAVVRAVKSALTGAPVDAFVRHEATCPKTVKGSKSCKCFCSVKIVTTGFDLLWEKGDAVNRYVYNGVEYTAVSRGTPDFLLKDFSLAKLGDEKELLQVSDQFRPIFMLDKSGTVVADVLSDVVKLDQINVASRLAEKDRKEASATRKIREQDVTDLRLAVIAYDGLDAVLVRVAEVEAADLRIGQRQLELDHLEKYIETAYGLARKLKILGQVLTVEVPTCETTLSGYKKHTALVGFFEALEARANTVAALSGVDLVAIPPVTGFVGKGSGFLRLVSWVSKIEVLKGFFDKNRKASALPVPSLGVVQSSHVTLTKLCKWASTFDGLEKTVGRLEAAAKAAQEAEDVILVGFQELGVCPTCSQNLTASGHEH